MGIASLILGIISLAMGWIPFICFFMFALAIVGLILGAIDICKKSKVDGSKKGIGIAGLVISALAIPVIIITSIVSIAAFAAVLNEDTIYEENNIYEEKQRTLYYDNNNDYWQEYYEDILKSRQGSSI